MGGKERADGTREVASNMCDWCNKRKAVDTVKHPVLQVHLNVCAGCRKEVLNL